MPEPSRRVTQTPVAAATSQYVASAGSDARKASASCAAATPAPTTGTTAKTTATGPATTRPYRSHAAGEARRRSRGRYASRTRVIAPPARRVGLGPASAGGAARSARPRSACAYRRVRGAVSSDRQGVEGGVGGFAVAGAEGRLADVSDVEALA